MAVAHHQTSALAGATSHGGSLTLSDFALSAGTDLVMIIFVASEGAGPTGIVWNGDEDAVFVEDSPKVGASTDENVEVWKLINPAATTADLVATFAGGGNDVAMWAQVYSDSDGTVGDIDFSASDGTTELTASVTTTVAGAMVVGAQFRSVVVNPDGWTPGTDVTERMDATVGAAGVGISCFGGDMEAPTTGTYNFTAEHSSGTSDDFNVIAIELQPTAGGGGGLTESQVVTTYLNDIA